MHSLKERSVQNGIECGAQPWMEVAEIKAMVKRLEERAKRKEDLVMERMKKLEEKL